MNSSAALPVLIPFATAIACLFVWKSSRVQRAITLLGAMCLLLSSFVLFREVETYGVVSLQMSGWSAPYGITLVADRFSAIMVLLNGFVAVTGVLYAIGSIDSARERFGFYPLLSAMFGGVSGAFLTGDVFNLYVWFEVVLMSSFVLLALGGERPQLEGAIKYVTLNLLSSTLFLVGIGVLYGFAGTLNFADLAVKLAQTDRPELITVTAFIFLCAFGIKAAAFPFFFWLPASYHTPPPVVSGIFAGVLTKVGVYSIFRMFSLVYTQEMWLTHFIILWMGAITMLTGVLGAAVQTDIRRILAFHSISQIGYMLSGFGIAGVGIGAAMTAGIEGHAERAAMLSAGAGLALTGSIFFVLHHSLVKMNLFFVAGAVKKLRNAEELEQVGGLYHARPFLGAMFLIPALSLAGIPILSGFWAKLALVRAGLEVGTYAVVAISLAVSILTLYSMTKIWANGFWAAPPGTPDGERGSDPGDEKDPPGYRLMLAPILALTVLMVVMSVFVGPAFRVIQQASDQLLADREYIRQLWESSGHSDRLDTLLQERNYITTVLGEEYLRGMLMQAEEVDR